jgi:excisionase family DNA binding protein
MSLEHLLELGEAARILGVHPSTLRRWADEEKVSAVRTLSGRRRFQPEAIEAVRQEMHQGSPAPLSGVVPAENKEFSHRHSADLASLGGGWISRLSEEQVMLFRYSGQKLLGLMMQFISRTDGAETFLEEARNVAGDYGFICYKAGLNLAETAEAFLHFRRSILESVLATSGLSGPHDRDGHRLFLRTIDFYDTILVATLERHASLSNGI